MEAQLKSSSILDSFRKLSNLIIQTPINHDSSLDTHTPPLPCEKLPKSQQDTRENSKEELSQDEEDNQSFDEVLKLLDDNQITVQKNYEDCQEESPTLKRRSDQETRLNYINRLVTMKVLNLQPKKKSQNVFIFDWDDTLFCTSFLGNLPLCKLPNQITMNTQILDNTASKLLQKACRAGEVFIITNSEKGWVEQSAQLTLPKTNDIILRKKIQIISARDAFQNSFPNDMYKWKLEAFLQLKRQYDEDVMTNLVVIGDSELEMKAGQALRKKFKQCLFKTVKLKECPKIDELIKQHKTVIKLFDEIFMGCKSMTIKIDKATCL